MTLFRPNIYNENHTEVLHTSLTAALYLHTHLGTFHTVLRKKREKNPDGLGLLSSCALSFLVGLLPGSVLNNKALDVDSPPSLLDLTCSAPLGFLILSIHR